MNKLFKISVLYFLLATFIVSCTKETDKFTPYSTSELNDVTWSSSTMSEAKSQAIINALKSTPYSTSFNSSNGIAAEIDNRVQLLMPTNSYLLNEIDYAGNINLALATLSTKGDFIRNLIPSCNSDFLYDSKKVFLVKLNDNNSSNLTLKLDSTYNISLVDTNLSLDYKFIVGNNVHINNGSVNWSVADSIKNGYLKTGDILFNGTIKSAYQILAKNIAWVNIAKPINTTNNISSNVILSVNNFTNKNTAVFAVFNNFNTVLKLQPDYSSKTFAAKNLPLGSSITLVSISYIDNQFYLGKQSIVVSNVASYTIKPSIIPASIAEVNTFLDGL